MDAELSSIALEGGSKAAAKNGSSQGLHVVVVGLSVLAVFLIAVAGLRRISPSELIGSLGGGQHCGLAGACGGDGAVLGPIVPMEPLIESGPRSWLTASHTVGVPSAIDPRTPSPHVYRGPCSNCHKALGPAGATRVAAVVNVELPPVFPDDRPPHGQRGPCVNCHRVLQRPVGTRVAAAAPVKASKQPAQEGHWQGLEIIPLTQALAREFGISANCRGVLVDDVTMAAAEAGLWAGDVLTAIDRIQVTDLESFQVATRSASSRTSADLEVIRKGRPITLVLAAPQRLGTAQMEGAPMITAGSVSPHRYQGRCTKCHQIGTTGQLAVDQGDLLTRQAPPIRRGAVSPHRDRGQCAKCHTVR